MRIRRLDLTRFGHFTDRSIDLPEGMPDFHIIYGPNEAGKSTTLTAIDNFLFGIPGRTPHNFLHDYKDMRVGAVLETDGKTLEAVRRKGTKDTLITPSGTAYPEGERLLSTCLGGADLEFFTRMFSLDHQRLHDGGRDIIDAKDDVGSMLFAAGAGISGLTERLNALSDESDKLWAKRRAGHRMYFTLEDELKAANAALREHTVTVTKWKDLKSALDDADQAYVSIQKELDKLTTLQRKTSRIRRVFRDIRRLTEVDALLMELENVPTLPEDAAEILSTAQSKYGEAVARLEVVTEKLEETRRARDEIVVDEMILLRAQDVEALEEQRGRVKAGKGDLPKLRQNLAVKEDSMRRLAEEFGWDAENLSSLVGRIPNRSTVSNIRRLVGEKSTLAAELESARKAIKESEEEGSAHVRERDDLGSKIDLSTLEGVLTSLRKRADITGDVARTRRVIEDTGSDVLRRFESLVPAISNVESLRTLPSVAESTVQDFRDRYRDLRNNIDATDAAVRDATAKVTRLTIQSERLSGDHGAISADTLGQFRRLRDDLWHLVRRRYIEGFTLSPEEETQFEGKLPACYESAVDDADKAADQRFDTAQVSAQLSVLAGDIATAEEDRGAAMSEGVRLDTLRTDMDTEWAAIWSEFKFSPGTPDQMIEWLKMRREIMDALDRKDVAIRDLDGLIEEETTGRSLLLDVLRAVGAGAVGFENLPLSTAIDSAGIILRDLEKQNQNMDRLDSRISEHAGVMKRRLDDLAKAEEALKDWRDRWDPAAVSLGLSAGIEPNIAVDLMDTIEEMRETALEIRTLREDRVGAIERLIDTFEKEVRSLASDVATDMDSLDPEATSREMNRRLQEANRLSNARHEKDADIKAQNDSRTNYEQAVRMAKEAIDRLKDVARVADDNDLGGIIEQSDSRRNLFRERDLIAGRLTEAGDGLSREQLDAECDGVDIDRLATDEESRGREIDTLRDRAVEVAQIRMDARDAFVAVGGDDAAARAEAQRQQALSGMKAVAEKYSKVRAAEILLRWTIERYRLEKQGPLLKAAGGYFAILTGEAFSSLRLDYADDDKPYLVGVRPGGEHVGVEGMSTGTADQLYLSLRVAAIDDYLTRTNPLPFMADDLFINFDNDRAAAGLKVLSKLAERTQVIFFTHHRHLVELAETTLVGGINIIHLTETK